MQRISSMNFDEHMPKINVLQQEAVDKTMYSFYVAVVDNGNNSQLLATLNATLRQKQSIGFLSIQVFYPAHTTVPDKDFAEVEFTSFSNSNDFYKKLTEGISRSAAAYHTIICSGEEFFENALNSVGNIFGKCPDVSWLTGIQTVQTQQGFNITLGSTAMRRWSYKIYERNLYKNSGRYIPSGSTFWRRKLWLQAQAEIHFVSNQEFIDDIWQAFFKTQKLFTCKIYLSTSHNYNRLDRYHFKQPNSYGPIEDSLWSRAKEFFFINNVPYLRWFYRLESNLTPVIRFDHNSQSYFLSKY